MSIFGRRRRLQEKVVEAKIETAMARKRLEDTEQTVAIPHRQLREDNHFAQMIVQSLLDGYGPHK